MRPTDSPKHSDKEPLRILLTGDVDEAFLNAGVFSDGGVEVQRNMLDAIDTAAKNRFAAIAVVMSGVRGKLKSILKALRDVNSDARLILLAQMYEEPLAVEIVGGVCNGSRLADDYLICPTRIEQLRKFVEAPHGNGETIVAETAGIDHAMEMKIRKLEELATTDELTGLKNRRYIWEFARQIIERARRENRRVTLLMFDIDDFKHYNDVYNHGAGDEILREAAVLMRRSCRPHDVVGRIGGDEFAVIFWDDPQLTSEGRGSERRSVSVDHPKEPIFIANRFRQELKKAELPSLGLEGKGVLSISGGLASFPRDGSSVDELFGQADAALLEAKRSGKNRIYLVGRPESDIADM